MTAKMAAIPTVYNGVQFRSRLEAKWAAFLTLLKVRWEYEPVDFNGWIPDFRIYDRKGGFVYAEVKPVVEVPHEVVDKMYRACPSSEGMEHKDLWVLGSAIKPAAMPGMRHIGWSVDPHDIIDLWGFVNGHHVFDIAGYMGDDGFQTDGHLSEEKILLSDLYTGECRLIDSLWAEAGNLSQWKSPR